MNTTTNHSSEVNSPIMEVIPQLLNYATLYKYYGLHQSTIAKFVMLGKFTNIVKIGRKNYFKKEDVEAWINAQTIEVLS